MAPWQLRRRALVAISVVVVSACPSAVASGAAEHVAKPPLTAAAAAKAKRYVEEAIAVEERALAAIDETRFSAARTDLYNAVVDLRAGVITLRDFDATQATADLDAAANHDEATRTELDPLTARLNGKRDRAKAAAKIDEAMRLKSAAIELLNQVLAPPPTSSALGGCAFESAQGQETVKASWPGEGGAVLDVIFGFGSSNPQTRTGTLNAAGIGYVGPFTVAPGATFAVVINASNPTDGKTASATTSAANGPTTTPASDCKIGG